MTLLRIALLGLLLGWMLQPQADEFNLPSIGNTSSTRMSAEEEKQLGAAFMRRLRLQLPISEDPEVQAYVWDLGYRLVSNSDYRRNPFHFFMVSDPQINAFAGPGGYIGVNAGLMLATETESELAAVVAHEISHVSQRHLDRAMSAAEKLSIPTAAALVAAIILGGNNVNIAEAALAATVAANIQTQLNFTRKHEQEADHVGIQILHESGFDPHAMPDFFERLQQNERLYGDQLPEFLRTHPVTTTRIAESRSRATQYEYDPGENHLIYALMKAKLRVLVSTNYKELIKHFEAELEARNYAHRTAHLYGYAYALLNTNRFAEAREIVNTIIKEDRERIPYSILLSQIELADGHHEKSLEIYRKALALSPSNRALSQYYAAALLQLERPEEAKKLLTPLLDDDALPAVYQLMAKAEGETGHPGAALRMYAEYYFMYGQTHTAIDQLNLALRQKDIDPVERRRIEKRMDELKEIAILERQL